MKRPLIYMTVGYITGIIWGLYLNTSIVPIFFVFGGCAYLYYKIINVKHKLKIEIDKKTIILYAAIFIIFASISNIQIIYLENKHKSLYKDVQEIEAIRDSNFRAKRNNI